MSNNPIVIRRLLTTPASWAIVGLSPNESRAAFGVSKFLKERLGMHIVPVHPRAAPVHGERGYSTLAKVAI